MPLIAIARNKNMADYAESIHRVGGETLEVGVDTDAVNDILSRVSGVLLTGGGDVDPTLYGAVASATHQDAEAGRDAFEIALARAAVAANMPMLAICRGMQVLNVAMGGSLVQDIPTEVNGALPHSVTDTRFTVAHEIWVSKGTRLWAVMQEKLDGESLQVNSRHHQAVSRVAEGFEVSATAPDGVIEAMERPNDAFCLAVQWHPENFWRTGEFRPLFEAFVEAVNAKTP